MTHAAVDSPNPAPQVDRLVIFTALLSAGTPFGIYSYIVEELTEAVIDALKKDREDMMG